MEWLLTIAKFAAVFGGVYVLIAVGLILSQFPSSPRTDKGLDFTVIRDLPDMPPLQNIASRNGSPIWFHHLLGENSGPLVVVLHGSSAFGASYADLAINIEKMGAEVILPDLRGHGVQAERRGDVDYIGQFEDDLQDILDHARKPGQKVIYVGHSSGGGLVARFAGGPHGFGVDGAVLLAPYLHYTSPTMRPNSGGWAFPLIRRTIGLEMLNRIGIKMLNGLVTLQFTTPDVPDDIPLTDAYSYRLNAGFSPRNDYGSDIAALPEFLVVTGSMDEAFVSEAFEPLMAPLNPKGTYHVLPGVTHLQVYSEPETYRLVRDFIGRFK